MTQEQDLLAESVARAFRFAGPGVFGGVNALQRQMAVEADLGEELESLERASLFRAFEEVIESSRGSPDSAVSPFSSTQGLRRRRMLRQSLRAIANSHGRRAIVRRSARSAR